jgi:DNA-binding MarR family transcriptional regulator/N-acetylglutamate synthase-like GNAT family acetyltransferase
MAGDIVKEQGALFLASRLKRLAERMQSEVVHVVEEAGLAIQPGQYSLLATLDRYGPQTIGELTEAMQLSQPAITRMAARLAEMELVTIDRLRKDQRHKTVTLTGAGVDGLNRSKLHVWPRVEKAVIEMLDGLDGPFLDQITAIERLLEDKPLDRRAQGFEAGLRIVEYRDNLAPTFRDINMEWISAMYKVEKADLDVLDNPRSKIIDKGGQILFVEASGLGIVGTCALRKTGKNQYELTKMGVLENARGLKAGQFLLKAVIARAEQLGARRLYLLSNSKSAIAIRLYEKLGFRHDKGIMKEFGAGYERCNVAMLYRPNRR